MKTVNWLLQAILIITGITVIWWLVTALIQWLFEAVGIEGIALIAGTSAVGVYATLDKESRENFNKGIADAVTGFGEEVKAKK